MSKPVNPEDRDCFKCNKCGMDMDMDPYCVDKRILKEKPWGLYLRHARPKCKGRWWVRRKNPK